MPTSSAPGNDDSATVLSVVAALVAQTQPGRAATRVELDSDLERDLGLDSIERAELLLRLERAFGIRLPARTLGSAESPRDLLRAVRAGAPLPAAPAAPRPTAPAAHPPVGLPDDAETLLDVLDWHARAHPERTHLTLLAETDAGPTESPLTYGALADGAARVAAGLRARGLEPGQSVAIMLPTSLEFFFAFFGILRAGCVPVPIYPPARRSQLEEHLARQSRILDNALAALLVTVPEADAVARLLRATTPSLRGIASVAALAAAEPSPAARAPPRAEDTAFLQYTSGSTGNPKGVILTHANMLANIRTMGRAIGVRPTDVFVSWLPLYHDMGLIGAWLGTLYYGVPFFVMPPTDFLARPDSWLRAIHRHRATLSAGPNFAYEMCAARVDASHLAGLDLSSWRIAFNGSEPVSPETIERFAARFAPLGFDPKAQTPVYGLAESAVGLAFPPLSRGPLIDRVDRARLMRDGVAAPSADPGAVAVVACGRPLPRHEIRVVDAAGREQPERREGRIEFRGPSATSGYFRNAEATRRLFRDGWLDTGDLGYVAGGELYVTGRAKDIIIRGGQHIHPQEAEAAIGAIPGIRRGCVTVFGTPDPRTGTEKVVVLAETREDDPARSEALRKAVAGRMAALLGAPADDILLVPPHTVLKTSSGKLRRAACRELYERGMPRGGAGAPWKQGMRLARTGIAGALGRARSRLADVLFGLYAWIVFVPFALAGLALAVFVPGAVTRRRVAARIARAFAAAARIPVRVEGAANFPATGALVVVANHASYADGILLAPVLPERCRFVAKRELAPAFGVGLVLRRIGTRFVERDDVEGSVEAARELASLARRGESLAFFPEGTFAREPGLRRFRMGAFAAAAVAGLPVVPVAIRGTRSVLRDGQWLPRRGVVQIVVAPPVLPDGGDFAAATRLRDRARAAILAACGEPDLGA